ncbi:MAG: class I SAM-dependent methyltransferase [Dysgonamonadaceae bacterium]
MENHYNEAYFEYQKSAGILSGKINSLFIKDFIRKDDRVLDFGCGGGFVLNNLNCKEKIGIEINPVAAAVAHENGVKVYRTVDELPDDFADVVISVHVLEHTHNPLSELKGLFRILKKGGRAVIIVPCESIKWKYKDNDIDQHLYTWSPLCIGNLMKLAGFEVSESKPCPCRWFRPFRDSFIKMFGYGSYFRLCKIYGHFGPLSQIRVVASKK